MYLYSLTLLFPGAEYELQKSVAVYRTINHENLSYLTEIEKFEKFHNKGAGKAQSQATQAADSTY